MRDVSQSSERLLRSTQGRPHRSLWEAKAPLIQRVQERFFKRLDKVKGLKEKRRRLYRKIDDLKKSWLGFIANEELRLIRNLPGPVAFIREKLDLTTFSQDDPNYRSPEHNRKINHSAKGKLKGKEDDKLTWDGIPVMEFPSYYSSTYCPACGHIHPDSRKGEKFKCVRCGYEAHADENACMVLGLYPFLTLKSSDKLLLPIGAGGTSSSRPEAYS
jgi:transposase